MINKLIKAINQITIPTDGYLVEEDFGNLVQKILRKNNIDYKRELRLLFPVMGLKKHEINRAAFLDGHYYGIVIADFVCGDIAIELKCVDKAPSTDTIFSKQCNTYLRVPGINIILLIILERDTSKFYLSQFKREPMPIPISSYEKIAKRLIHLTPRLSLSEFVRNLERNENERSFVCQS